MEPPLLVRRFLRSAGALRGAAGAVYTYALRCSERTFTGLHCPVSMASRYPSRPDRRAPRTCSAPAWPFSAGMFWYPTTSRLGRLPSHRRRTPSSPCGRKNADRSAHHANDSLWSGAVVALKYSPWRAGGERESERRGVGGGQRHIAASSSRSGSGSTLAESIVSQPELARDRRRAGEDAVVHAAVAVPRRRRARARVGRERARVGHVRQVLEVRAQHHPQRGRHASWPRAGASAAAR